MTKTTIIKVADFDSIYNVISSSDRYAKIEKQAAKADAHPYWFLLAKLATSIKYGAVKFENAWFPVIAGEIDRKSGGYQFSTAAYQIAAYGRNVSDVQHITSL